MSCDTFPAGPEAATSRPPRTGIDAVRWPDVVRVPSGSAARTALARAIAGRALRSVPLRTRFPDGTTWGSEGPLLTIRDPRAFFARIGVDGLIGFGESYLAGEWETEDLVGVLGVLAAHVSSLVPGPLQPLRGLWARRRSLSSRNTLEGARANIARHYDLSNELFAQFLDETWTYSSAVFRSFPARWELLAEAQHRKIDRLLDLAGVSAGTRLLEIGTGWGELALRAAARGARVTSITLSRAQRELAARRVDEAGLSGLVDIRLCDYRDIRGQFDAVVSVEMIEAVGAEFWPVYFQTLDRCLAPEGRVALQAITMPHDRMLATRTSTGWIDKYIFPGGVIPSLRAIDETTQAHTALRVTRADDYGEHYAETLRLWRERFTAHGDAVDALGFDATFRRMWTFYLAWSEAGFRTHYLKVHQLILTRAQETR